MTWRTNFVLLIAVLSCALYIRFHDRFNFGHPSSQTNSRLILPIEARDVESILITQSGSEIELRKNGASWFITKPIKTPANPAEVYRILDAVAQLKWIQRIETREDSTDPPERGKYGLAPPNASISIGMVGNKTNTLLIGSNTAIQTQVYVRPLGGPSIFVTSRLLADSLPGSILGLRERRLLGFSPGEISRIECITSGQASELIKSGNKEWDVVRPFRGRAIETMVISWLEEFYAFRIDSFIAESMAGGSLYGLDKPAALITFSAENQPPHVLKIGNPVDLDRQFYYAAIAGQEQVFSISAKVVEWANRSMADLRDFRLLPFNTDEIISVSIIEDSQALQLEKTPAGTWTVAAPVRFTAYEPRVRALLDQYAAARVIQFDKESAIPDTAEPGATRAITFMLSSEQAFTIRYGESADNRQLVAEIEPGGQRVYLPVELARLASAKPIQFRDPVVFSVEPTNILRITQSTIPTTAVVASSNGIFKSIEPGMAADTEAVTRILDACTSLRAKELVTEDVRDLSLYGLDPANHQLVFSLAIDGINRVLLLGRATLDGDIYAMRQGVDLIFTLSREIETILTTPIARPIDNAVPPNLSPQAP